MAKASMTYDNRSAATALMFLLGSSVPLIGFLFTIAGVVMTWTNKTWPLWSKIVVSVIVALWVVMIVLFFGFFALLGGLANSSKTNTNMYLPQNVTPTVANY